VAEARYIAGNLEAVKRLTLPDGAAAKRAALGVNAQILREARRISTAKWPICNSLRH
jgi:hypothetical protein